MVGLSVDDLSLEERLLLVRSGKGGKQRTVPLSRTMVEELQSWLKLRLAYVAAGEKAVLINLGGRKASGRRMTDRSLRKILNAHYRRLGFPRRYYGAHMLRHTAGTRFYKTSRDLHATARLLGHANVNTSTIYAKMDLEGLFEVVDKVED
jgi:integrase/recombinase XerC